MTTLQQKVFRQVDESGEEFARAVLDGFEREQKSLPCRFLYDAEGSRLFDEITALPEYYLTRSETEILEKHGAEIAHGVGPRHVVIEYGAGTGLKTELLLACLPSGVSYVPVDVSEDALASIRAQFGRKFPSLRVYPILGDFWSQLTLPPPLMERPRHGLFLGSTIGNLVPAHAVRLLSKLRRDLGIGGVLTVGVDLKSDRDEIIAAYNDSSGVTAAFNLNILARINRELEGTFDLDAFRHEAVFNESEGRMEMYLVSLRDQWVRVLGKEFYLRKSERIHTENSYKYTIEEFLDLARRAGWHVRATWTDACRRFSLHQLAS
jgi:dimethylhistidine N-methyltransferase